MPPSAALARREAFELESADLRYCRALLARGSRSFSVASWLLPRRVRAPAVALYAFCRVADDLVDDGDPRRGLDALHRRVDLVYAGSALEDPVARALAAVVRHANVPRAVLDMLLDGFAWDAQGREYSTLSDVHAYGVRVASTVGVVMALLMGERDRAAVARACDLGVAMQLTNIARDVGEDARRGRIYLPGCWLAEAGVDHERWLSDPVPDPAVRAVTLRVLDEADRLYHRAAPGIEVLPADCRPAIRAAAWIYRDIGRVIRGRNGDSVSGRAHVAGARKLLWLLKARLSRRAAARGVGRPALPAAVALVDAVASGTPTPQPHDAAA